MLLNANALKGFKLDSLDGEFGEVSEFYFDDRHWAIRTWSPTQEAGLWAGKC